MTAAHAARRRPCSARHREARTSAPCSRAEYRLLLRSVATTGRLIAIGALAARSAS